MWYGPTNGDCSCCEKKIYSLIVKAQQGATGQIGRFAWYLSQPFRGENCHRLVGGEVELTKQCEFLLCCTGNLPTTISMVPSFAAGTGTAGDVCRSENPTGWDCYTAADEWTVDFGTGTYGVSAGCNGVIGWAYECMCNAVQGEIDLLLKDPTNPTWAWPNGYACGTDYTSWRVERRRYWPSCWWSFWASGNDLPNNTGTGCHPNEYLGIRLELYGY